MKIIKKVLIAIVAIIALLLIVALFVPKEFDASRSIVIDKPRAEVFDYIKYIKNQDHFGVWQLSEPEAKKVYTGEDGTVGFVSSWDGKKIGKGSQKIINLTAGEKLQTELNFGFGEPAVATFTTEDAGENKTKVTWGISGKTPYPFNLMSLFYDMGNDFDQGLKNLKAVLEK